MEEKTKCNCEHMDFLTSLDSEQYEYFKKFRSDILEHNRELITIDGKTSEELDIYVKEHSDICFGKKVKNER